MVGTILEREPSIGVGSFLVVTHFNMIEELLTKMGSVELWVIIEGGGHGVVVKGTSNNFTTSVAAIVDQKLTCSSDSEVYGIIWGCAEN